MLWHDNFFTLPDGKTKTTLKLGEFGEKFIILHPHFHFGSLETPFLNEEDLNQDEESVKVYFQQFEVDLEQDDFEIDDFVSEVEKNYHPKEDESLYYETGFWSGTKGMDQYMGIGTEKLAEARQDNSISDFAICFSNNISVLVVSSKKESASIVLSLYASNDILPFIEVTEPFQKKINTYKSSHEVIRQILPEHGLRRYWRGDELISILPIAFLMDLRDKNYRRLPIIQNPFGETKDEVIKRIHNLTGVTRGGFIESDYGGQNRFSLRAEIWELSTAAVVEFIFDQMIL